jgi:hypothetical protein
VESGDRTLNLFFAQELGGLVHLSPEWSRRTGVKAATPQSRLSRSKVTGGEKSTGEGRF